MALRKKTVLLNIKSSAVKLKLLISFFCIQAFISLRAQDTFSILGIDSITGEVGAAGASCVDMFMYYPSYPNDFITEVFPGMGAIATQAAYLDANKLNAAKRFTAGDSPAQIISWLISNDVQGNSTSRQYGVVKFVDGSTKSAAFTGTNCMDYKNHVLGPNYSIQGNILSGKKVLDSMEARFLRQPGDLACKLMAAMQGANTVGADSRCAPNNSSSLFAFIKVAKPTDDKGVPYLYLSLRTHNGAKIEPIDSLQKMFNAVKSCTVSNAGLNTTSMPLSGFSAFPNPVSGFLIIKTYGQIKPALCSITDLCGRTILEKEISSDFMINVREWTKGAYFIQIRSDQGVFRQKIIVN